MLVLLGLLLIVALVLWVALGSDLADDRGSAQKQPSIGLNPKAQPE